MLIKKTLKIGRKLIKLFRIIRTKNYLKVLLRCGVAPVDEHYSLLKTLKCNTIVDVGANKGQFSLLARNCFPDAKIYSFEPLSEPANKFRCVFKDDKNMQLYNLAIGSEKINTNIHVSKSDDSSSLLPITSQQSRLFPGTEEDYMATIEVDLLDNYIDEKILISPSLLKIDVQGYELEVLNGSKSLLGVFDYVYVECSFIELYEEQPLVDDVLRLLNSENYSLSGVYNLSYDSSGICVQGDFLFSRVR